MEIFRKLHSILTPNSEPAVRSQPRQPRPGNPGQPSFADTLRAAAADDGTIRPFGVQNGRLADGLRSPQVDPGSGQEPSDPVAGGGGPTVLPEAPEAEFPAEVPIDSLHIEMRETLESLIIVEQERAGLSEPVLPPIIESDPAAEDPVINEPTGSTTTPSSTTPNPVPAPRPSLLPPLGVEWASMTVRGSGATGKGVNGTDAAAHQVLVHKHQTYNNPGQYGMTNNQEARLFLDAVDRGYVPNTPEGLGTLLGYLGKGAIGADARPPEMTEYFRQFFVSERTANV